MPLQLVFLSLMMVSLLSGRIFRDLDTFETYRASVNLTGIVNNPELSSSDFDGVRDSAETQYLPESCPSDFEYLDSP